MRAACGGPGGLPLGSVTHFHSVAITQPVHRLQIRPIVHNRGASPTTPPSYIRVRAIVWACGRGQIHRHADRHADARDHNIFLVVYDSRELQLSITEKKYSCLFLDCVVFALSSSQYFYPALVPCPACTNHTARYSFLSLSDRKTNHQTNNPRHNTTFNTGEK